MYEMTMPVTFSRTGKNGFLRLGDAVGMMMDCCQFQEYQEKALKTYLQNNGIAIFLFSLQLDIFRLPRFRETVRTTVKIYGCKSIYGLRRLTMHDEHGELCMICNATGAFFDLKAGRAVKVNPEELPVQYDEAEKMACLPRKIPLPDGAWDRQLPSFTVLPSAVDCNGHLTSAAYFAFASDVLPETFTYNRVRMEYKHQARQNDVIQPEVFWKGTTTVVNLTGAPGGSFAVAEFSTAEIPVGD